MVNPNQFKQSVVKGMLDLKDGNTPFGCQVDAAQVTALKSGQAVKLVATAGGVMKVIAVAADTDEIFGYVAYNIKQAEFSALEKIEIVGVHGIVYLEASAAIPRNSRIMNVVAGEKIAVATVGKRIGGLALDTAAADGDLIRVLIADPIVALSQA